MRLDSKVIRYVREAANISKQSAADLVGVSKRTWDSWESGQRNMPENVFRYFIYLINGEPLEIDEEELASRTGYEQILVFFDYSNGIIPIDSVSTKNFFSVEVCGDGDAILVSLKMNRDGTRTPVHTRFSIEKNRTNFNKLVEWRDS